MKMFPLAIIILTLAVIAFGSLLPANRMNRASPAVGNYSFPEPFRGSQGGKTVVRACGNCHSNQTKLPWYGHVAPISWWIERHVRDGRQALNFSAWTTYSSHRQRDELEAICGVVSNGRMPPASYKVLHPESRLEAQDKKVICAWTANESEHEN